MCYVGQVCKLCSFIIILLVVAAVVFTFVYLRHEHHHHGHKCAGGCSPPSSGYVPFTAAPPLSSTRPFISADSPVHR